jgi:hypothetical protein
VIGRRGRIHKQLLDNFKENRGYWKLKEEALHCTMQSTCFGKGYGPVVQQTREEKRADKTQTRNCTWEILLPLYTHTPSAPDGCESDVP